jgi:hypothetical protein
VSSGIDSPVANSDTYIYGNGPISIRLLTEEQFVKRHGDDSQCVSVPSEAAIDLVSELPHRQKMQSLFHDMTHQIWADQGVEDAFTGILKVHGVRTELSDALIELLLCSMAQGMTEIATRNPGFWMQFSLREGE